MEPDTPLAPFVDAQPSPPSDATLALWSENAIAAGDYRRTRKAWRIILVAAFLLADGSTALWQSQSFYLGEVLAMEAVR